MGRFLFFKVAITLIGIAFYILTARLAGVEILGIISISIALVSLGSTILKLGLEQIVTREFSKIKNTNLNKFDTFVQNNLASYLRATFPVVLLILSANCFLGYPMIWGFLIFLNVISASYANLLSEFLRTQGSIYTCQLFPVGLQPAFIYFSVSLASVISIGDVGLVVIVLGCLAVLQVISSKTVRKNYLKNSESKSSNAEVSYDGQSEFFKINLLNQSTAGVDLLVVGFILGEHNAGLYSLFQRMLHPFMIFLSAINSFSAPAYAMFSSRSVRGMNRTFLKSIWVGLILSVGISAVYYFFGNHIISIFGDGFSPLKGYTNLAIVCGLTVLGTGSCATLLTMSRSEKTYRKILFFSTILFLIALPISSYMYGLSGALFSVAYFLMGKSLASFTMAIVALNSRALPAGDN